MIHMVYVSLLLSKDGLAPKPPMGYNSWNDLECRPSEAKLQAPGPQQGRVVPKKPWWCRDEDA